METDEILSAMKIFLNILFITYAFAGLSKRCVQKLGEYENERLIRCGIGLPIRYTKNNLRRSLHQFTELINNWKIFEKILPIR